MQNGAKPAKRKYSKHISKYTKNEHILHVTRRSDKKNTNANAQKIVSIEHIRLYYHSCLLQK